MVVINVTGLPMILTFKNTFADNLHIYQFVSGHKCRNEIECIEEYDRKKDSILEYAQTLLGPKLNQFLSLAAFLMAQKKTFALLRYSPDLNKMDQLNTNWRYDFLANDFEGNGVDKGFVKTEGPYVLYEIDSPTEIENIPEDVLEEEYSNVTLFGLNKSAKARLNNFLKREDVPSLTNLLEEDELFINIVIGKQYGYFNSFLAKSKARLDDEIAELQNVTDAAN